MSVFIGNVMGKKGQIAIFIILGFIILIAFGFIFYLREPRMEEEVREEIILPTYVMPVKSYVEECIKSGGETALSFLSIQAGEYNLFSNSTHFYLVVRNFYIDGENVMPSIEELENDFSNFIKIYLSDCMNKFPLEGYALELEGIKVDTNFLENEIVLKVDYPVTIKKDSFETEINDFYVSFPVRMKHIYDTAEKIVNKEIENPNLLHHSFLLELDTKFVIIPYNEERFIFIIYDNQSKLFNEDYMFMFGMLFNSTKMV